MADSILKDLRYSNALTGEVKKLVAMHMRPNLYLPRYSTAAVRRIVRDAGDLLDDLLALSEADITSQRAQRVEEAFGRLDHLRSRCSSTEVRDAAAARSPLTGEEIMEEFGLEPGPEVGRLKRLLVEAAVDGVVTGEDKEGAVSYLRSSRENLKNN